MRKPGSLYEQMNSYRFVSFLGLKIRNLHTLLSLYEKGFAMTEKANDYQFENTNRWDTRQLVTMALMCAIGVLLSFIEFPLLPGAAFLKYDASMMPAMVCGFAYGPVAGISVGVIGAVIHGIMLADFSGAVMNIIVVFGFILPAALYYKSHHSFKGAVIGLVLGTICATLAAILGNLAITPLWLGVPLNAVLDMIIPILTPFNLIKSVLNSVLTLIVYKSISNLITPKKKQVKGRQ